MATVPINNSRKTISRTRELISFAEAMEKLSRDDRFRATIYAMNTLLVQKGIYSPEEFELHFRQFAQKQLEMIRQDKERWLGNLEQELIAAAQGPKMEVSVAEVRQKGLVK